MAESSTDVMIRRNKEQAEYCNLPQWWASGYTGKGITVWDMEGMTSHGKLTRRRVTDAAPFATVINGHFGYSVKNGKVTDPTVYVGEEKTPVALERFLAENRIRIITCSKDDMFKDFGTTVGDFWADIIDRYDLCVFSCSMNDGKKNVSMTRKVAWQIGALSVDAKGNIQRAGYSNAGEGLDFVDFTSVWSGTSVSTPYLAGKAALILQRYPQMRKDEMYEYLRSHCKDLGDAGEDPLHGNGLVILPDVYEIWGTEVNTDAASGGGTTKVKNPMITTTQVLVDSQIKTVNRVMVDNENYIRLRDMDDVLGICEVDYDQSRNLPIVKKVTR